MDLYAGTWDLPIHAAKYSLYRAAQNFQQYIHTYIKIGRSSHH
jgi:hypothetical protein